MASNRPYIEGARLMNEVMRHNNNDGGTTAVVYGSKGSGKTTLLLTLAQSIGCYDPYPLRAKLKKVDANENITDEEKNKLKEKIKKEHKMVMPETIMWRGRDTDYWYWLDKKRVVLFFHETDYKNGIHFKNDYLQDIPESELPKIKTYRSIESLYKNMVKGAINVVYEPRTYKLTENIKTMIKKRGGVGDEIFKSDETDRVVFWFEVMDWLLWNKLLDFLTIIFDEADELFPASPSGIRWHLNLWAKHIMKDLRKRNISMIIATHGYTDIDGRMNTKIQYRFYLRGSITPSSSLINTRAPILLPRGRYYIEGDGWGWVEYDKIEEKPRILVYFKSDNINGSGDGDDTPDVPPENGAKDDITIDPVSDYITIDASHIKIDDDGKLIIDVSGLNETADDIAFNIKNSGLNETVHNRIKTGNRKIKPPGERNVTKGRRNVKKLIEKDKDGENENE